MTIFTRRRSDERGQGSLELTGVVAIASLLVTILGTVFVASSPVVRDHVAYRLCQITSIGEGADGCEKPGDLRTPEERIPPEPCLVGNENWSLTASASVVVTVEKGYSFLVERLSDGTYRVTRVDSEGVGVGVGPGFDVSVTVDGRKYGLVGNISADAMLKAKQGDTWYADSQDGVDDLIQSVIKDDIVDEVTGPDIPFVGNPLEDAINAVTGSAPDPDESFVEGGIEGNVNGAVSNILFSGGFDLSGELYLGAKKTDDGFTAYYRGKIDGEIYMGMLGVGETTPSGSAEGLFEMEFDNKGNPTALRLTTETALDPSGDYAGFADSDTLISQNVWEMPIKDNDDLQTALLAMGSPALGVKGFIDAAERDGYRSQNNYRDSEDLYGLTVGGKLLGKYGGSIEGGRTNRELLDSKYWDGQNLVDRPDC